MTLLHPANRVKIFCSSLWRRYAGHPRIHFWDYGM